jgi:major membrane immunogen (membrane-anchored lipoprotein)
MARLVIATLCLALLLTACGASGNADAQLGPNPGGGYFGANVNVGTINPSKIYDGI